MITETSVIAYLVAKEESVEERSVLVGSNNESNCGLIRSENVGLSNENIGENPVPRKPKDSFARFVREGLVRS